MALGDLDSLGWHQLKGELTPIPPRGRGARELPAVRPPFDLLGLQLLGRTGINEPGTLYLGGLTVETPDGEQTLTDFSALEGWQFVEDYAQPGLYSLDISRSVVREGHAGSASLAGLPGAGVSGVCGQEPPRSRCRR